MSKKSLQFQQLENKMQALGPLQHIAIPPTGWIKAIRLALGISLQQLGKKLSVTRQAAKDVERREIEGSLTLNSLRQVAQALDMQLVYGFVPKDKTLDALVNRKALELARKIVMRTSNTMKLEDQQNSSERIEKAIEERAEEIKKNMPKILWD